MTVGSRVKVDASGLPGAPAVAARPAIQRLLVANRGELVVRIARTCRRLGIATLALVADDQARASWTRAADELVPLNGTYLDIERVVDAARLARADAIHPGYGFLAENAEFAQAVMDAGIAWIGPSPGAMRALGDKAAARRMAATLGVPTLAGYDGDDQTAETLLREAKRIGFPVLLKPSAGGGGKGMHVLASAEEFDETVARARREAAGAFGDDRFVLERYLARPRHVEVQLLGDRHGNVIHVGERECSLQRRHQKVIEEAPSAAVDERLRRDLGTAAIKLAAAAGYQSAGTAEFLIAEDGSFYFLELNARLQVEHPVTELVTGRDLVADQIAIAVGKPLPIGQPDLTLRGHAIEARLYAEDPWHEFVPATGEILDARFPAGEGLRVDAGVDTGDVVGTRYDPLLAKLVAHGASREEALDRMRNALESMAVVGVTNNRGFLRWLVSHDDVRAGRMWTTFIDERWRADDRLPEAAWTVAAAALSDMLVQRGVIRPGFRLNAPPRLRLTLDGEMRAVEVTRGQMVSRWAGLDDGSVMLDVEGRALQAAVTPPPTVEAAVRGASRDGGSAASIAAPMPGSVIAVRVAEGDAVEPGQVLVVLEAMKMENTVPAPAAGRVERVLVEPGQQVQRGETLVELA